MLPVGYSQNGYSKKRILRHYTGRLQEYPITRVSNFPRILGNYTHEQTVVTFLFPSLNAWVQVYQLSIMSTCQTPISFHTTYYKPDMGKPKQPFLQYSGYFNTWTMDHGLDSTVDWTMGQTVGPPHPCISLSWFSPCARMVLYNC